MRAWNIKKVGDWESMTLDDIKLEPLLPGQARLRHLAGVICFADILTTMGNYIKSFKAPFIPGFAYVAVVEEVCEPSSYPTGCPKLAVGDVVADMSTIGAWTTHSNVSIMDPTSHLVKIEDDFTYKGGKLDLSQVVSLVLNAATAYGLIHQTGINWQDGDYALVQAAAGSVGSLLVQLLKIGFPNVKVIGTASAPKHEFVKSLGADPIDYKTDDVVKAVMEKTGGNGVKAAFDALGAESFQKSWSSLTPDGKVIMFGFTGNNSMASNILSAIPFMAKANLSFWQSKTAKFFSLDNCTTFTTDLTHLVGLVRDKKLVPHVDKVVTIEQVKETLESVKAGQNRGSLVVALDPQVVKFYSK